MQEMEIVHLNCAFKLLLKNSQSGDSTLKATLYFYLQFWYTITLLVTSNLVVIDCQFTSSSAPGIPICFSYSSLKHWFTICYSTYNAEKCQVFFPTMKYWRNFIFSVHLVLIQRILHSLYV